MNLPELNVIDAAPHCAVALAPCDLHLWLANLDEIDAASLDVALSHDERERARRLCCPMDRARFTAARGLLRQLLERYTGCRAGDVQFAYGAHGKPSLASNPMDLRFNLSR